ncbi:quinone oxidoreductase family protein [Salinisphaera hydrothermalis]|uniref:NADPH:quinone reductase n=1 Tax=Salinisphaera hydrothermalis (strain C41B8) TaxID=1304275 RepID=A0A084IIG4_SALHC|nr:quinone oxidoreductase [Salinisphaera hydrothermalis]KEZ76498.1 zinc-binding alcohol dehydrogenase [Salinisphaera hydrothermalis C41B8]
MARQIQFQQTGGPDVLELVDTEIRDPGPGEVRVTNHAIGVNFIDIYFRTGLYPADLPSAMGTEGAGVIDAVGDGVEEFAVGDRVAYVLGPKGAYADAITLSADHVVALPEAIDFETAAASLLKGLTVQYLLRQTYAIAEDDTILFHAAAGGVGTIACQWARALGAHVIGTVSSDEKADIAKANGAWMTIDYTRESVPERVMELTDGAGVPVVYDSVGRDTWHDSLKCLRKRGLMVSFGNASGPVEGVNLVELNRGGSLFVTRPSLGGYADTPERFEMMCADLFAVLESGDVKVHIGQRYDLADAGAAQQAIADRKTTGSTILLP